MYAKPIIVPKKNYFDLKLWWVGADVEGMVGVQVGVEVSPTIVLVEALVSLL